MARPRVVPYWQILLAILVGALAGPVAAQPYPSKPIRFIVPFAPGGGTDLMARFIAQRLAEAFGTPVVVENKPGAGGAVGIEGGVRSAPDGYTLMMVSSSYTVNAALGKFSFDALTDIAPVIQISRGPDLIVVNPSLPVRSIDDLISLAKAKQDSIAYASTGAGSITHVATELLCKSAAIKMLHVPYKGTGPALSDTIAGQTQVFISSPSALLPHVKSGRLRAIAVTTNARSPALPDVPTVAESGFPGFEVVLWHGLLGPKGMTRPIVERLNAAIAKLLTLRETTDHLENDAAVAAGGTPDDFRTQIRKEIVVWRKLIANAGIRAD